jgi:hypothetical protein
MAVEQDLEQRDARAMCPDPDIQHGRKSPFASWALSDPAFAR